MNNDITNAMKSYFDNRTKKHIALVNYFAKKFDKEFPNHDCDKFDEKLYESYIKLSWAKKNGDDIPEDCKHAIQEHLRNNKHHPESFDNLFEMSGDALIEFCADICAMSKEFRNDPFNYLAHQFESRWNFNDKQKDLIYQTVNVMWSGEQ